MGRSRRKLPQEPILAHIDSLSPDGRGVARVNGKAVFVHGGLPGEDVRFTYTRANRRYDEGVVVEVLSAAPERVPPRCPHFGSCGGCSLQHMAPEAQLRAKQQSLVDALEHIGKVRPRDWLEPLDSPLHWGYRRKARLGAKYVVKKQRVLVGFRERSSAFVADLSRCDVLHPRVGGLLRELRELIEGLSIRDRVPQIELAVGDGACVLVFRIMAPLTAQDRDRLESFGAAHGIHVYLQEAGPESVRPLSGLPARLSYRIPDFDLELQFLPTDFTQVNTDINRLMVRRAVELLAPQREDRVLDLFCGLGNFTLPLARRARHVTGVEGDPGLVARASDNALHNYISNVEFRVANLYEPVETEPWMQRRYRKALLDPPRSGAQQVLGHLPRLGVERLVYVSCYPSTLARDAGALVHEYGYRLTAAGVMDMFPHTAHVESIALFERSF